MRRLGNLLFLKRMENLRLLHLVRKRLAREDFRCILIAKDENQVKGAENWKLTTSLATFDADEWLLVNSDKKGKVISLSCKVCKSYFKFVETMKHFSKDWVIEGSTNLQLSNAERQAKGDPHNHAITLYWKDNLKNEVELADKLRDKNQETIT